MRLKTSASIVTGVPSLMGQQVNTLCLPVWKITWKQDVDMHLPSLKYW